MDNGKRAVRAVPGDLKAAKLELAHVEAATGTGRFFEHNKDTKITLGEVLDWYGSQLEGMTPKARSTVQSSLRILKKELPVHLKIKDVPRNMLADWIKLHGAGRSGTTQNLYLTRYKVAINESFRAGMIESKPCMDYRLPKVNDSRERIISDPEYLELLAKAESPFREMVKIAFFLPLRAGDIVKLNWPMIDLHAGIITLPAGLNKTKRERRVAIHPAVREMLLGLESRPLSSYVFTKTGGTNFASFPNEAWAKLRAKCNLNDVHFHDFKHTAISNLVAAGTPEFLIRIQSGNKGSDSLHIYTNATNKMLTDGTMFHPDPQKTQQRSFKNGNS